MLLAAFLMGFLGSAHCVGMCGPIALIIEKKRSGNKLFNRLLYNTGRLFTYSFMGVVAGAAGRIIFLSDFQQGLSVGLGVFIIILAGTLASGQSLGFKFLNNTINKLKTALGKILKKEGPLMGFSVGALNGLLPCGMVYMALAASLSTSSIPEGVVFMLFFGLGTFPALFISSAILNNFFAKVNFYKLIPVFIS
ncbi:MAG: sulfite exporter TauE/SafE family protein, partial [Cyclobacteriaceae bacterium]|nr:sulfite exporter TauE/SafE family protein [Cyclobacteriaceae bacterium]